MDGISRGTTLGGRYELDRALSNRDDVEQWIARDTTLGREVTVTCFAVDHAHASAALDSARRVAGVEDRRLSQVLDVGTEADVSYVVSEATHHSQSVAALLRHDTLPAEEVRRLIGESAVALETARQRGLHHQILNPHHVLRSPDGAVQVADVALGAALAGREDEDGDLASRDDVVALVSVAYAGLTGQWPGAQEVPGVPTVERTADGQVPAPSALVSGVPGDLDTLCRTVLNDGEGPRTPGELARQLSPWSSVRVHGAGGRTPEQGGLTGNPHAAKASGDTPKRTLATGAAGAAATGAALASPDAVGRTDSDATDPGTLAGDPDATVIGRRPEFDHDETTTMRVARHQDDPFVEEDLEPPLPLLTTGTAEPDRDSSRLALAIVAGTVVLAMLLGYLGLRSLFSVGDDAETPASPQQNNSSTSGSAAPTSAAPTTPAAGQPIKVASITSFDPEGDGNEHNEVARDAIDQDPDTTWITHRYTRETFTRNGKQGAGLILDLGSSQNVGTVKVNVDGPSIGATVYVTDEKSVKNAPSLGTFSGDGEQSVSGQAKKGRYVIVWVTRLGQEGSRAFRATISEITVAS